MSVKEAYHYEPKSCLPNSRQQLPGVIECVAALEPFAWILDVVFIGSLIVEYLRSVFEDTPFEKWAKYSCFSKGGRGLLDDTLDWFKRDAKNHDAKKSIIGLLNLITPIRTHWKAENPNVSYPVYQLRVSCSTARQLKNSMFHLDCGIICNDSLCLPLVQDNKPVAEGLGYTKRPLILLPTGQHLGDSYRIRNYHSKTLYLAYRDGLKQAWYAGPGSDLNVADVSRLIYLPNTKLAARVQLTSQGITLPNGAVDDESKSTEYLNKDHYAIAEVDLS